MDVSCARRGLVDKKAVQGPNEYDTHPTELVANNDPTCLELVSILLEDACSGSNWQNANSIVQDCLLSWLT